MCAYKKFTGVILFSATLVQNECVQTPTDRQRHKICKHRQTETRAHFFTALNPQAGTATIDRMTKFPRRLGNNALRALHRDTATSKRQVERP